MKPELFPKEIIENSAEGHFVDHNVTSKAIYLSVLFFIVLALACLPFIFVDISVKSNGLIRPLTYKNIITAPVSGRVKAVYMEENTAVQKDETVLIIETDQIEGQILTNNTRISKVEKFIDDLNRLIHTSKFDASTPIIPPTIWQRKWLVKSEPEWNRDNQLMRKDNMQIKQHDITIS